LQFQTSHDNEVGNQPKRGFIMLVRQYSVESSLRIFLEERNMRKKVKFDIVFLAGLLVPEIVLIIAMVVAGLIYIF